jgi:hypothetical protein
MSYQPIIPVGGLVGWSFLQRTMENQTAAFNSDAVLTRDTDYFEANIGKIDTAEQLVGDRRLLRVALGAFGLQDDIDNKYFIQKMLEDGTINDDALSNRLTDPRYKELVSAFGFGDFDIPSSKISDFGTKITAAFRERSFEVAVGEQNDDMRLSLNADRELVDLAADSSSNDAKWFKILGSSPLKSVFQAALAMPSAFGQLDIDKQLELFKDRAESVFGTSEISDFSDPALREKLIERQLLMSQINSFQTSSSASIALTLLQS